MMNLAPKKRVIACLALLLWPLLANSGNDCYHKGQLITETLPELIFDPSKNPVLKDLRNAPYAQFNVEQKSLYEKEITRLLDAFWVKSYHDYVSVMQKSSGKARHKIMRNDCSRCTEIIGRTIQTNGRIPVPARDTALLQNKEVVRSQFILLMSKALDFDDIVFNGQKVTAIAIKYMQDNKLVLPMLTRTESEAHKVLLSKYSHSPELFWGEPYFPFNEFGTPKAHLESEHVQVELTLLEPGQILDLGVYGKQWRVRYTNGNTPTFYKDTKRTFQTLGHMIALTLDTKKNMLIFDPTFLSNALELNRVEKTITGFHQGLPKDYDALMRAISENAARVAKSYAQNILDRAKAKQNLNSYEKNFLKMVKKHKRNNGDVLPDFVFEYADAVDTTTWW